MINACGICRKYEAEDLMTNHLTYGRCIVHNKVVSSISTSTCEEFKSIYDVCESCNEWTPVVSDLGFCNKLKIQTKSKDWCD